MKPTTHNKEFFKQRLRELRRREQLTRIDPIIVEQMYDLFLSGIDYGLEMCKAIIRDEDWEETMRIEKEQEQEEEEDE